MTSTEFLLGDDRRARLTIDAMPSAARATGPRLPPALARNRHGIYGLPDVVTSRAVPPDVFLLVDDAVRAAAAELADEWLR